MSSYYDTPSPCPAQFPDLNFKQITKELRAAYVGARYPFFELAFQHLDGENDTKEASKAMMCRPAGYLGFFMGPIWFFYRKMRLEGFIILAIIFTISFLLSFLELPRHLGQALPIAYGVIQGSYAKKFYWKAVDRKIARAKDLFPHDPNQALAWLESKGGVSWLAVVVYSMFYLGMLGLFIIPLIATR